MNRHQHKEGNKMLHRKKIHICSTRGNALILLAILIGLLFWPGIVPALDLCGCEGHPGSLGAFDTADEGTYPAGTTRYLDTITIPLPDDGILIFNTFTVALSPRGYAATVNFEPNAANTPVTLLVAGDVTNIRWKQIVVAAGEGCKAALSAYAYLKNSNPSK